MNLSFSKIPNNGQIINLHKEILVPVDFDRVKNRFIANYKPLDIKVESSKGSNVIELFAKEFVMLYKQKDKKYQKHFNQIIKN